MAASALALVSTAALAALPGVTPKLLPPAEAFRLSARAIDPATIEARFDVVDGYYLYRDKLHFSIGQGPPLPAELPRGQRKRDEFFGDVETYRGSVVIRVLLPVPASATSVTLNVDSQGCADVGVCYPPNPQQLELPVPVGGAKPGAFVDANRKRGWFK